MNSKSIWFWSGAALVLLGLIVAHHGLVEPPPAGPPRVLPRFESQRVGSVHVRPRGQLELRAERAGSGWVLTAPVRYVAQGVIIDELLAFLEKLSPAAVITAAELRQTPGARDQYGFAEPQASLVLMHGDERVQVLFGALTAPGDQVFLQVVGMEEVFVVDARILAFLPRGPNDWRDTAFARLRDLKFDLLAVTNGTRTFVLHRASEEAPWRMVAPIDARADNARVAELLQLLDSMPVAQFVQDDPGTDLQAFGLQRPDLQIGLNQGTNPVALFHFGGSPTNAPDQVYALRQGTVSIVTVPKSTLVPWRLAVNDVRDPHLISDLAAVGAIRVEGEESFLLELHTNGWRVLPQNFAADVGLVNEVLGTLARLRIAEFTKDIVTTNDLPTYGLATPVLRYVLQTATALTNGAPPRVIAQIEFGTNTSERIFVRRTDEPSVYAVALADVTDLPIRPFQLRNRQLWDFSENEVKSVTIRQHGGIRQIDRRGPHDWALAPGSQGVINDLAIEETVRPLCSLTAAAWLAKGDGARAQYGLGEGAHEVALELKDGTRRVLHIGTAPIGQPGYAGATLDGEFWVFRFPASLYRFVATYLTIPAQL